MCCCSERHRSRALAAICPKLLALAQTLDSREVSCALLFLKRQVILVFSRLEVAGTGSCRGCCHLVLLNFRLLASADLSLCAIDEVPLAQTDSRSSKSSSSSAACAAGAAAFCMGSSSLSLRPYTSMLMSCLTLSESSTTFSKFKTRFRSTL